MSQTRTIYAGESLLYDMEFPTPPLQPGEQLTGVLEITIEPDDDLTVSNTAAAANRAQFRIDASPAAVAGYRDLVVQVQGSQGNTPKGKGILRVARL